MKKRSTKETKHNQDFLGFVWSKNLEARKFFLLKVIGVSTLLFSLVYNSINNYMLSEEDTACINDKTVTFTKPINSFFKEHTILRTIIIIYSSLILDFILLSILHCFIFYSKNYRIFLTFFLFYALKGILHGVFVMQAPSDILWEYPGVYSLTFSHFSSNDFFYSGQIGMSTISLLEFKKRNFKYLKWLSFNCLITQVFVTLILRTNYIIDIVGGFVFAHYFYIICEYLFPEKVEKTDEHHESHGHKGKNLILKEINLDGKSPENELEAEELVDKNSSFSSGGCSMCSCKWKLSDHLDEGNG